MSHSPLSISRRHVLGDLYGRCDPITDNVPVYLSDLENTLLGHMDQCLGHYADAFTFHIPDDVCKKLAADQFTYSINYDHSEPKVEGTRSRVTLNSITLNPRKPYEKPVPAIISPE